MGVLKQEVKALNHEIEVLRHDARVLKDIQNKSSLSGSDNAFKDKYSGGFNHHRPGSPFGALRTVQKDEKIDQLIFSLQQKIANLADENKNLSQILKRYQKTGDPLEASLRKSIASYSQTYTSVASRKGRSPFSGGKR